MAVKKRKWRDLSRLEQGGIIVGGSIVLYLLYKGLTSEGNVQQAPVDYGQVPIVYTTPGGQGVLWDADPLAMEISNNLEGYNLYVYPETTDKIWKLQDQQLNLLYNHYNTYYAEDQPTLTKLIENEWPDTGGSYNKAVAKLRSLGLNENRSMGYIKLQQLGAI